jgi:hypothetical protein
VSPSATVILYTYNELVEEGSVRKKQKKERNVGDLDGLDMWQEGVGETNN